MTIVIALTSQKGGVGKTTSAVHLSTAFALGGYKTLLMDIDPQGSVYSALGFKHKLTQGTLDVFCDPEATLEDVVYRHEDTALDLVFSNMTRLSYEQEVTRAATDYQHLHHWIEEHVEEHYDFVLLDAPASTSPLSINAMVASDIIIVPLQCEALAIRSLKRFLMAFQDLQNSIDSELRIAGILMTMFDQQIPLHQQICRQVYQTLGESVFDTIIPKCVHILDASAVGTDVINRKLNSVGATGYIRLANEVLDRFELRSR